MSTILITGATGQLGQIVIDNLLKSVPNTNITALVRDETKAEDLKAKGINIKVGNYFDVDSLKNAMIGIDKVLLISSNDFNDRISQHKNVIDAAKISGVKHIYYTSIDIKDIDNSALKPLLGDHILTENHIIESGLTYTFLKNSLYYEVIPMFLGDTVFENGVFFAAGDGKVTFTSRKDLGIVTAKLLIEEGHENKSYPLSNTQAYSFHDVAAALSEISGKTVNYFSPESKDYEAALKSFGLPDGIVLMSVLFAEGMKNNDFEKTNDTLEKLLGHSQTDLRTFLKEVYSV